MSRRRRREEDPEPDAHNYSPTPASKRRRRRRQPPAAVAKLGVADDGGVGEGDVATTGGGSSAMVLVNGLRSGCTVLELKSRMQMYGDISRIRIDSNEGIGYVTFRSPDSARAAISASVDPVFGITIGTRRVHVSQARDPVPQWQTDLGVSARSKLLKAELPLRKHGKGNKKLTECTMTCNRGDPEMPYEGRQIVAYDDLL